jgi:hypothetical protein
LIDKRTATAPEYDRAWMEARADVRERGTMPNGLRIQYGRAQETIKGLRGKTTAEVLADGGPRGSAVVYDDGKNLRATDLEPRLQDAAGFFPKALTERLDPVVLTSRQERNEGGSYNENGSVISITDWSLGTFVHEFTHHIEYQIPDVSRASWAFLMHRTQGEETRQMYSIMPGAGFKRGTLGFRDKFNDPYSGRLYDNAYTGGSISRNDPAREVLTTATDNIFAGPRMASRKIDDEQRQFTLGILALASQP